MADSGKPLNRDEMEAKIKYFDIQIEGIREGILTKGTRSDFDPNSESVKKLTDALEFYQQQKQLFVDTIKRLDSTDAF